MNEIVGVVVCETIRKAFSQRLELKGQQVDNLPDAPPGIAYKSSDFPIQPADNFEEVSTQKKKTRSDSDDWRKEQLKRARLSSEENEMTKVQYPAYRILQVRERYSLFIRDSDG